MTTTQENKPGRLTLYETLTLFRGERLTPVPDALLSYGHASPREQLRRTRVALEGLRALYRKRFASLSGCLFFMARVPKVPGEPVESARRVLFAVAGTTDLAAWERATARADVHRALDAAVAHCSPRSRWLAVQEGGRP